MRLGIALTAALAAMALAYPLHASGQSRAAQTHAASIDIAAHVREASQRFGIPEHWIYAVIRGSAVTQDGRSNGLTVPKASSQVAALKAALAQADVADSAIADGISHDDKPLLGVPLAIKDVIAVKNQPLTCSSKILGNFNSPYEATVIGKLREAGATIFGRLNMDEFAMGSSNENSAYFATKNPWNLEVVPGGSSGGSAAAVAAREAPGALGSETGGSIRQPAAFCGVVGLKPTYGRVSRFGLVAFASSLDQIGPLAQTVDDTALLLQALAGPDKRDSTCSTRQPDDYLVGINEDVMDSSICVETTTGLPFILATRIIFFCQPGTDSIGNSTPKSPLAIIIPSARSAISSIQFNAAGFSILAIIDTLLVQIFFKSLISLGF